MAIPQELMGLGMPAALATKLGNNVATVNGVGTTQTGAAKFVGGITLAVPTTSNTAFLCDSSASQTRLCFFYNTSSSQTALIFPPSGGSINSGAANAALSVTPLTGVLIEPVTGGGTSAQKWWAILGISPAGLVPVESLIYVQSAITLASQTGVQPAFVGTSGGVLTNGEITLPMGTYEFVAEFNLSAMSSTSGGFGFALGTANSAVIGQQGWSAYANKATLATPAAPQFSWNTAASTELATASTATVGFVRIEGTFTLTTAGSIIPQLSFTTVAGTATPIVGVGSYFKIWSLGSATVSTIGNWS